MVVTTVHLKDYLLVDEMGNVLEHDMAARWGIR